MEREIAAIPEKEKLKGYIKLIIRIKWSRKKEESKKIKASIEKNCINLFLLYLLTKKLCTNIPILKIRRFKPSTREPIVTGTPKLLK